jgi:branched-chain amino acid transport system permease protein
MDAFLHQIFSGLANGCIYGSVGLGLVMIYQATHHINFAQGEMATFSTFIAWALIQSGWPYWAAFFVTVAISFTAGLVIQRIILRPVEKSPVLTNVIVFIGLLVIFNSMAGWIFDHTIKSFPSPFAQKGMLVTPWFSAHEVGSALVMLAVRALRLLPLHAHWLGDARGGTEPGFSPAGWHPRELDAGNGLGPGSRDRLGRRHDGCASGLP